MKDNEISQVVNVVTPLLKKNTFQEDMNMKQEENLVEVQAGILCHRVALNYMVAKVLGYEPWIAKNNSIHHTVRAEHKSNNPQIKYVRLSGSMTDSFDIYEDPALVGAFLFNRLYNYNEVTVGAFYDAKIYIAESERIIHKHIVEPGTKNVLSGKPIQSVGTSAIEAGFKLLVIEEMNLASLTDKVEIPEYLAQLLFPGKHG